MQQNQDAVVQWPLNWSRVWVRPNGPTLQLRNAVRTKADDFVVASIVAPAELNLVREREQCAEADNVWRERIDHMIAYCLDIVGALLHAGTEKVLDTSGTPYPLVHIGHSDPVGEPAGLFPHRVGQVHLGKVVQLSAGVVGTNLDLTRELHNKRFGGEAAKQREKESKFGEVNIYLN